MEKLKKMDEWQLSPLIRVVFGLEAPSNLAQQGSSHTTLEDKIEFIDPTLNESQKDAIRFALGAREIALIHGPPGVRPQSKGLYARHTSPQAELSPDRQDLHADRTDSATRSAKTACSSLWTLQHLR